MEACKRQGGCGEIVLHNAIPMDTGVPGIMLQRYPSIVGYADRIPGTDAAAACSAHGGRQRFCGCRDRLDLSSGCVVIHQDE